MSKRYSVGIDIGSTASKVCVLGAGAGPFYQVLPTGWNSKITAGIIRDHLEETIGDLENAGIIATGYGRISVDYADAVVTEITCHGRGGYQLIGRDCSIVDVGGQDTKFINVRNGKAVDFLMNDKCAAGTGKFIEVMANRLGLTIEELFEEAGKGTAIPISSICTVFAESEVINYMGEGKSKEDLAAGVIDSVAQKVVTLMQRKDLYDTIIITGGLSSNEFFAELLSKKLKATVLPQADGRYAGALGAALIAKDRFGE
ncbi:acyl-CoA dehydratase activase [Mobilibacterium timonense]|uniref:acyl-CoA dehydratase activase n=1 Tax=Mobilibacterium timonense TaxID=1871012 RepID=UPI0009874241|nr:acyl-CoA dehydratase activase [Mobilibacterium timonense]MBM6990425.1 CoA activase [Mobilibacterium timonense]